ncbi:hypothetical protein V501_02421 [Pseudogymnoascus sp. VKM F-4519 (FW-2642)]|nr:hypothetical protein V501_02421 [Pseudogymnoascus sp. VKM F-4519 (FW-2642)]
MSEISTSSDPVLVSKTAECGGGASAKFWGMRGTRKVRYFSWTNSDGAEGQQSARPRGSSDIFGGMLGSLVSNSLGGSARPLPYSIAFGLDFVVAAAPPCPE